MPQRIPHNDRGEKWCGGCQEFHSLGEFHASGASWDGRAGWCKTYAKRANKAAEVRRLYGLTLEEYERIMAAGCAICDAPSQHLDHCHTSGAPRGALCRPCNMALGLLQDDPARLDAAARYLREAL